MACLPPSPLRAQPARILFISDLKCCTHFCRSLRDIDVRAQQQRNVTIPLLVCAILVSSLCKTVRPPLSLFQSFKRLSLFSPAINIISARWCSPCSPLPLPPVRLAGLSATGFHKKFPFLSLPRRRRRRLRRRKKREVEEGYFPPPFVPLPPQVTLKCRLPPFPSLSL